jgi:hypothetical protein
VPITNKEVATEALSSLVYLVLADAPGEDVLGEVLVLHEAVSRAAEQPGQVLAPLVRPDLHPGLDSLEDELLAPNVQVVVAQYQFQLVAGLSIGGLRY